MSFTTQEGQTNAQINARLKALYDAYTPRILSAWSDAYDAPAPFRMNEFGIIDIQRYHAADGVLFLGRETNGWSDQDYADGCLFRDWLCDISRHGISGRGHVSSHPNMWYNIGRWALLLQDRETSLDLLARQKEEAIHALGTIAFTNINKVKGKNKIGREYHRLANTDVVRELLQKEVAVIQPSVIVACGTWQTAVSVLSDYHGKIICMNHPGARKSTKAMLQDLQGQIR